MAEHKIIIPVAVRRCLSLFTAINVPLPGASPEMAEQLGTQNAEPNAMWPQIAEPSAGWPQPSKSAGRRRLSRDMDRLYMAWNMNQKRPLIVISERRAGAGGQT